MAETPTIQITLDCADPHAQAEFWASALGYEVEQNPAFVQEMLDQGFATQDDVMRRDGVLVWKTGSSMNDSSGSRPRWYFQQVAEAKTVKNRMHLDVQVGAEQREAEVDRLLGLGAKRLYEGQQGPHSWVTLADPEGNEFCVS